MSKAGIAGDLIGINLSDKSKELSRTEFFELLKNTFELLDKLNHRDSESYLSWLIGLVSSFAAGSRNTEVLSDLKHFLTELKHPVADNQIALLDHLNDYDTSEKPDVVLARIDPDIATWIKHIRQSDQPKETTESA